MNPVLTQPDAIAAGLIRCANDIALTEARTVLADIPQHPVAQVAVAARTILRLSRDEAEVREAFEVLRTLDQLELIP